MKVFVNLLTVFRLIATFLIPIVWNFAKPIWVVLFVGITLITDFLDGKLARMFKVQSLFGSVADSFADKIFGIVILLILAQYYRGFYLIIAMEILIALINVGAAILGATTKSSFLGKCKMWVISFAIIVGLIYVFKNNLIKIEFLKDYMTTFIEHQDSILSDSIFMAVGSGIIVAIDYFRHVSKELLSNRKRIKYKFKSDNELKTALFDTEFYLKNKDKPISSLLLK